MWHISEYRKEEIPRHRVQVLSKKDINRNILHGNTESHLMAKWNRRERRVPLPSSEVFLAIFQEE